MTLIDLAVLGSLFLRELFWFSPLGKAMLKSPHAAINLLANLPDEAE